MGVLAVIKAWVTPPDEAAQQRRRIDERIQETEIARIRLEARIQRLEARRRMRERGLPQDDP